MTEVRTGEARRRVEDLVASLASQSVGGTSPADPDEVLGALDSMGLVELVVALEKEFSVALPADLITVDTFSSVDGIVDAVRTCVEPTVDVHDYVVDGRLVTPPDGSVIDVLGRWASSRPDAPFLTWLPASGEPEVLTYGELESRSRSLAAILSAGGDLSGQRIAVLAANDIPTVVAMFALVRAGATCLFLNPLDPPGRLRPILAAHSVSRVYRTPYAADVPEDLALPIPDAVGGPEWEKDRTSTDRPAFMFGTSGSTAATKLVLQSHRALLSNAQTLQRHHGLDGDTVIMGCLPLHHVNGVHFTVMAVLHAGAHVVIPQRFDPLRYRAQMDEHRPHIASVVPTILETVLATGRGWRPPASLRYFVTAAAPMTASLAKRVVTAFGVRVVQGYGLTETTNFSTTLPVDLSDEDYAALILDASIPTVGVALDGNEIAVLSKAGEPLGEGEVGEVCMRGHNVMDGYADRPDVTAEAFAGGWFHSGDLGYWTEGPDHRRYFHLTGRIKNIAKVRGEVVSLEEVERALCSLDGVVDAGCTTLPHALWGEEIVAAVTLREVDVKDLADGLASLVPATAIPRRWYELPEIPRTPTGKLRRVELLDLLGLKGTK